VIHRTQLEQACDVFCNMPLRSHDATISKLVHLKVENQSRTNLWIVAGLATVLFATLTTMRSTSNFIAMIRNPCVLPVKVSLASETACSEYIKIQFNRIQSKRRTAAKVMIGVLMMDTSASILSRKALRVALASDDVDLRFVICQPRRETMLEGDVVRLDMPENMNYGKTQGWFSYALENMGENISAVFKMDTDSIFCLADLKQALLDAPSFSFFGLPSHHVKCGTSKSCPPKHCVAELEFKNDCWYYMQGGLYGLSAKLLRQLPTSERFRRPQTERLHEDMATGMWVNETAVRGRVRPVRLPFKHNKELIRHDPHIYERYINAYIKSLRGLNCARQVEHLITEKRNMTR
jgi:Galactosyltransferase